ncbi:MAG: DUF484 family protein [Proteobacteria bacterium]|nr:DUF484 family protein [Pseudomonadota bacterium]MBS0462348.1 DUF484 family protein [Pseudomonadota bacterium]MBS0464157.1 DUF484 family protein [Pseudomonadota bacterium]
MSESSTIGSTDVAAFLRRNPRFLNEYPDLALGLVVPREEGRATSLASYQLDVLRDKNRELNKRLHELFHNAQENERLTVRTHQLVLALLRARSPADTLKTMAASLTEDFQGDLVRVLLHRQVEGLDGADWLSVLPRDAAVLSPFAEFFAKDEPLCGRLQAEKLEALFGARQHEVQSCALLPLHERGLIAIGSHDANRFYPGMGTLFLRLMGDSLVVALERYDG